MFYQTGISFFFHRHPALSLFLPVFFLFFCAHLLLHISLFLFLLPPPFSFLFFIIFRTLSRKLQSMPRRRAMENVCVLVDSSVASLFLYKRFSLYLYLQQSSLRLCCSLQSMVPSRRVSLFSPLSLYLSVQPLRWLVYHAPFPRLIKRLSLKFSCVTSPIFIPPIFVTVFAYILPPQGVFGYIIVECIQLS